MSLTFLCFFHFLCKSFQQTTKVANSLDPDQDQQNVCPDVDPNHLTLIVSLGEFSEKN